ncbi:DUF3618 domain-containing protein [Isoptericola sp. NEAU-Y5]|uniref:DUF3618 domain-containing protein n=1 Tax=Isoptericola luteus TaxID=2879484 RepID=A0ABS7ZAM0_9MICO|nr:DUF3618 domain-containing protein [Isoptericola sp. NEAU-Y5]MCA5892105.1 DUF3618 domain-containing protein [Isoptericola sp. NEAU-Y5]
MSDPTIPRPETPAPTPAELEAEVRRSRSELGETLDLLVERLSPRYQATQLAHTTKQAASDLGTFVTGGGLSDVQPQRERNAKILLGAVAAGIAVVAIVVIRSARR